MLELSDLKEQGFILRPEEANDFLSEVNAVRNGLNETGIIYPDNNQASGDVSTDVPTGAKRGRKPNVVPPATENRVVTQADLDADPTLVEKGIKLGDNYDFPISA